jgi:hypothetical protein
VVRLALLALSIVCTAPALLGEAKDRPWQDGVLTFRQTVMAGRGSRRAQRHRYVYRIHAPGRRYLVRLDEPLRAWLYSPVSFWVSKRHLFIRDEDGSEHKAAIVHRTELELRR